MLREGETHPGRAVRALCSGTCESWDPEEEEPGHPDPSRARSGPTPTSSKTQASWEFPTGTRFFRNGRSTPFSGRWASSNPNPCIVSKGKGHFKWKNSRVSLNFEHRSD